MKDSLISWDKKFQLIKGRSNETPSLIRESVLPFTYFCELWIPRIRSALVLLVREPLLTGKFPCGSFGLCHWYECNVVYIDESELSVDELHSPVFPSHMQQGMTSYVRDAKLVEFVEFVDEPESKFGRGDSRSPFGFFLNYCLLNYYCQGDCHRESRFGFEFDPNAQRFVEQCRLTGKAKESSVA